ncbi:phosrestin-1 [Eupeodes corollae]|uniref:phosrestin-1 n=1 Tax=Eupeodes corollae TaxID=290404 RepID=UPI002493C4D9|nr:phosrestin-1 [Eupeodes corollae]
MVVSVKVFKKATPNGKVCFYLGRRDFIDHLDYVDPVDGVIVVDPDYLKNRKVFGQLVTTYRYGREEDEVMGVKFSKEMILCRDQIVPVVNTNMEMTPMQEKLVRKLGANAYPFTFHFPPCSPSSVTLQQEGDDNGKPLGVEYTIRAYVADSEDDRQHKRSMVSLVIKKLQYAPPTRGQRLPSSLVSKGFTFSNGKISLEVTLDREIYYHGEKVAATMQVNNNSKKKVQNIKVFVIQHTEITMVNAQFSKHVASLETKEGCPITPGANLTKTFYLVPLASSNKDRHGIALDGHLKDEDVNLASATMVQEGKSTGDAIGIVISYSVRVKLNLGTLGGEIQTDVPFKLLTPAPGTVEKKRVNAMKKMKSIEQHRYDKGHYQDDDDNIVFEDFAKMRMNNADMND